MGEYNPEKTINGLSVERRTRLAAINANAGALGLNFKLIDEHSVANDTKTDDLITEAETLLNEFEIKRNENNAKLDEISRKVFNRIY